MTKSRLLSRSPRRSALQKRARQIQTPQISQIVLWGPGRFGEALLKHFPAPLSSSCIRIDIPDANAVSLKKIWADFDPSSPPLVILGLPFSALDGALKLMKPLKIAGVLSVAKGIDREQLLTFTPLAKRRLSCPQASLSGPTFAAELSACLPTAAVIAGEDKNFVQTLCQLVSHLNFRVYASSDPIGVEVSAAIKNVLAIAAGISDGLKLGLNARAALLARGLKEMGTLVKTLGGDVDSVFGLAGVGDLILTATGDLSRNRQFGNELALGKSVDEARGQAAGPVEGYYTAFQIHQLAKRKKLDLPICEEIFKICYQRKDPKESLTDLMTRALSFEESRSSPLRRRGSSKRSPRG